MRTLNSLLSRISNWISRPEPAGQAGQDSPAIPVPTARYEDCPDLQSPSVTEALLKGAHLTSLIRRAGAHKCSGVLAYGDSYGRVAIPQPAAGDFIIYRWSDERLEFDEVVRVPTLTQAFFPIMRQLAGPGPEVSQ